MKKIYLADKYNRARLILENGEEVIGKAIDVMDAEDGDGVDLGYQWLVFWPDGECNPLFLREEDIQEVFPE